MSIKLTLQLVVVVVNAQTNFCDNLPKLLVTPVGFS